MGKMFKKLSEADMNLLRAFAIDDDDAILDALAEGANPDMLVSREFLDKLRVTELARLEVAGFQAKALIEEIRDKARGGPP